MGFSKLSYAPHSRSTAPTSSNHQPYVAAARSHQQPQQATEAVEYKQQAPQPILGSFADLWEVRQASDILLEDTTDKKMFDEAEQQQQEGNFDEYDCYLVHPMRVTTHNPYSLSDPICSVFMCHCDACVSMGSSQSGTDNNGLYTEHVVVDDAQPQREALQEDTLADEPVSMFMPPPPPRLDTGDVFEACECPNAQEVVYHMMLRWYHRVARAQSFFVAEEDFCAAPPEQGESSNQATFQQWCREVNQWWYKHFEHRQKKVYTGPRGYQTHNGYW